MSLHYSRKLIERARELRKTETPQERKLWFGYLKAYPARFQRQKVIASFIADFYCHQAKLIIEVDGAQHSTAQGIAYDNERAHVLSREGLCIVRFTNQQVDEEFHTVCKAIDAAIRQRLGQ